MIAKVRVFAPAKINIALHVVGQRADGYHLLDTLVGFASVGDWVTLDTGSPDGLTIAGPEADGLMACDDNLVTRAARAFWSAGTLGLHLDKHLPVASGIGGGSADAAACIRGIDWLGGQRGHLAAPDPARVKQMIALGADVPMCVPCQPARAQGIGERITPLPDLAKLPIVLVNPRVAVPTPMVFKALATKQNPAMSALPPDLGDATFLTDYLSRQRNDLQAPAIALAPVIATVLDRIAASQDCALSRMSGSGATCFGIYPNAAAATAAAEALGHENPGWWVRACALDGQDRAAPQPIN